MPADPHNGATIGAPSPADRELAAMAIEERGGRVISDRHGPRHTIFEVKKSFGRTEKESAELCGCGATNVQFRPPPYPGMKATPGPTICLVCDAGAEMAISL